MDSMSGKYKLYFGYNNDKMVLTIPVLPDKIKISIKGQTVSANIDKFGEIIYKGKREGMVISFSSFFPNRYGSFCSCTKKQYKSAKKCHAQLMKFLDADKPIHLVLTGSPFKINMYAVITSYTPYEQGGDVGTVYYSIELKEYRLTNVRKISKSKKTTTKTPSKKRTSNKIKKKSYTVKKGDCLWNIAIKFYGKGKGSQYTKIYKANKNVIEKAAKKYGHKSSNNGNLIFPGTKLTIP